MPEKLNEVFGLDGPLKLQPDNRWVLPNCNIGIEIEVENIINTPRYRDTPNNFGLLPSKWKTVDDGSLRNGGIEFVSNKLFGIDLYEAILFIVEYLQDVEPGHDFSHRTSLHIHLDVSDLTFDQLSYLIQLYCLIEKPLFNISGNRENNEYCIPFYSSLEVQRELGQFLVLATDPKGTGREYLTETINESFVKYLALNIIPITNLGSIEFRHHEGTGDFDTIYNWICTLQKLKACALDHPFPEEPYKYISEIGPYNLVAQIMGQMTQNIVYPNLAADVWQGARVAQTIFNYVKIQDFSQTLAIHNKTTQDKEGTLREIPGLTTGYRQL